MGIGHLGNRDGDVNSYGDEGPDLERDSTCDGTFRNKTCASSAAQSACPTPDQEEVRTDGCAGSSAGINPCVREEES